MTTSDGEAARRDPRIAAAGASIGYSFRADALVLQALRHASVGGIDGSDNERLEFLGDALIGLAMAADLYAADPGATEGQLTERRARKVSRAHLARVARRIGLEPLLELRPAPVRGSAIPGSVLAGALEALLGAVLLDGGFEAASAVARGILNDGAFGDPKPNAKAELQHRVQVRFGCVPTYKLLQQRSHAFGHSFCVAAVVDGRRCGPAWGRSKREAEALAAEEALRELEEDAAAGGGGAPDGAT